MGRFGRRFFLRGGGVALALPLLDVVRDPPLSHAGGAGPEGRAVIFHFPNGCDLRDWIPTQTGAGFAPTPLLAALGTELANVNVLTGLGNAAPVEASSSVSLPHPRCSLTCLTGVQADETGPAGPSVDQRIAATAGASAPLPSLNVAVSTLVNPVHGAIAWQGQGSPVPAATDPGLLFDQLFADALLDPKEQAKKAAERQTILDHVKDEIDALRGELGTEDRVRLDEHLTAVEQLEASIGALECEVPDAPPPFDGSDDALQPERARALIDLVVMALRCQLTRSVVFSIGPSGSTRTYPFLGLSGDDHEWSHSDLKEAVNRTAYGDIVRWKLEIFAYLLEQLGAAPEGDGTLLDHCAVVGLSELSKGGIHDPKMLPVLAAGGLGGMSTGQHIVYPCDPAFRLHTNAMELASMCTGGPGEETPLSNLWLTLLHALGVDDAAFGNATGTLEGLWI